MTRFLLIRHALTDAVGKTITGRLPGVHINDEGKRQVSILADQLKGLSIDAMYSSPMERAMETANTIAVPHQLNVSVLGELNEIDCGEWSGRTIQELRGERQFQLFNSFRSGTRIPGGETMLEAQLRMVNCIEKLAGRHKEQTVVLVSHGDPLKATACFYMGIHLDLMHKIEISPASVTNLEVYEETARITSMGSIYY
jgi:broad specificity phosphatase PhoE